MNPAPTIWLAPPRNEAAEQLLAHELHIDALTARLLVNRGIVDPDSAEAFFNPSCSQLHDPFLLPDMDRAARRIADAIVSKERIFVHGDYDADGVTSTALYIRAIESLGGDVIHRVPHRKLHGYDIKKEAIAFASERGTRLILTTDCGIQAEEAVNYANHIGIPVIVTDHHEPGARLPKAHAIVNPHRADSQYPYQGLAGVGVAFKTMQAVVRLIKPAAEARYVQRFLDLVALGTIADMMPLTGENRIFARFGLEQMSKTRKLGLDALVHGVGLDPAKALTPNMVGFQIAPKINAVGRMDDAERALDLLLTDDAAKADELVKQLVAYTDDRRTTEAQIIEEVEAILKERDVDKLKVIVVAAPGWNGGVVGIVATRIVQRFGRPTLVLVIDEATGTAKGSGRSIPEFDLHQGLTACGDKLDTFGGHKMAAGMSLALDKLTAFDEAINAYAEGVLTDEDLVPKEKHDGTIDPNSVGVRTIEEWAHLAPFGNDNPSPRFAAFGLPACGIRTMGRESTHLQFRVGGERGMRCVGFGLAGLAEAVSAAGQVDVLFEPQINSFNGSRSVELKLKACRPSGMPATDASVPDDLVDATVDLSG